jgi:hypothetical protein
MPIVTASATISAGQSLSSAVDCTSSRLVRIYMPDAWLDAPLTFEVSSDNTVFRPVHQHDGYELQMPCQPGTAILVPDFMGAALAWLKIRSGTRGRPIVQPAARAFTLIIQTGGMPLAQQQPAVVVARKKPHGRRSSAAR